MFVPFKAVRESVKIYKNLTSWSNIVFVLNLGRESSVFRNFAFFCGKSYLP
jgi:hypothetical protein